jgi:DNA helicase-2/ATP-dependent DNA helicase PcrA
MLYGRTNAALASRFLREIPEQYILRKGGYRAAPQWSSAPTYRPAQKPTYTDFVSKPAEAKPVSLELNKGDMVQHAAFGRGMVLSVMKMGGDALLEIAFDQIGTKKLMAKTA